MNHVRWIRATLCGVLAVALMTGCGPTTRRSSDPFAGGGGSTARRPATATSAGAGGDEKAPSISDNEIRIRVRNADINDATVYARGSARRQRLGRMSGVGAKWFKMNWPAQDILYFEVDLLGGEQCRTQAFQVAPGATVYMVIDVFARSDGYGSPPSKCRFERG